MRRTTIAAFSVATLTSFAASAPVRAEMSLSFYGGPQTAPHSRVKGDDGDGTEFNFLSEWEGKSFEAPPHYGVRGVWWRDENLGFGVDFNHVKVYASDDTMDDNGFENLELTDGLNILTANVFYRWPGQFAGGALTPYVSGGLGIAVPHVDVEINDSETFGYQVTGPAVAWIAGVSYDLNDRWAVFGEYKGTFSSNEADLDNGGELKTDIVTNALNVGLTLKF
ncbi:MAG: outer membrane beta-barrel protein [Celeribacter sp.]|jgi:lipid A oxidase